MPSRLVKHSFGCGCEDDWHKASKLKGEDALWVLDGTNQWTCSLAGINKGKRKEMFLVFKALLFFLAITFGYQFPVTLVCPTDCH